MKANLRDLTINRDGSTNVTFTTFEDVKNTFDALKDIPVEVTITKARKGRSKDANRFCWALCSDIGRAMTPPLAKEDVYRMAIKAVGVYWQREFPIFHLETVRRRWESGGEGWFMEVVDNGEPGRRLCNLYFGSSTYTVDEMRVLLDWLVDQAEQMQIPIPLSKKEEDELLERWGKK